MSLDLQIFQFFNSLGYNSVFTSLTGLIVNEYFVPVSLSLLLFFLLLTSKKGKQALLLAAASVGTVNLIIKLLNLVYFRERPFIENDVNLLFYRPTDSSFPSNAAAVAFAISFSVWFADRRWGTVCFILSGLYAVSRIVAGVHFPSDVIAGAVLGFAVAFVFSNLKKGLLIAEKALEKVFNLFDLKI